MVRAGVDSFILFDFGSKRLRLEGGFDTFGTSTLDDMVSKLVLLARTPNEHSTFVVNSQCMVSTTADVHNILEFGIKDWFVLDLNIRIGQETEDTIILLLYTFISLTA